MLPVSSSNILEMGHDPAAGHAYVRFRNGGLWRYHGVPENIYDEWRNSGSVGKYLGSFIKPNHHAEKVS